MARRGEDMKVYESSEIDRLIDRYQEKNGEVLQISEGTLGHGELVLSGQGLKTAIIKEVYLNEWSSGHTVRMYNEVPKKYKGMR